MTKLREAALAAWEQRKQQMAESDAEKKIELGLRTRAALTKIGVHADLVDGTSALVDGVHLRRSTDGDWQVAGTCPDCGAAGWSPPVSDLAGIGQYLDEFRLDYGHVCRGYGYSDHDLPNASDRLLAALAYWLAEQQGGQP